MFSMSCSTNLWHHKERMPILGNPKKTEQEQTWKKNTFQGWVRRQ
ncbi:hypothetical protein GCHA_4098 [Paraglaciecola chathamensis S18K6]|uniref:Transposase n=1 Tax=Paraglaciecola chathamensis S18K6 TaxID=1127672 RepID=A0AAV3UXW5_9ALTE|nr:hypothetical protein GCHA_4098 [Paraglaciecola chathamensis S18K6]